MPLSSLTASGSMKKRRIRRGTRSRKNDPALATPTLLGRQDRLDERAVVHPVEAGLPVLDLRDLAQVGPRIELARAHHLEHALPHRPGVTEAALQRDRLFHQ